MIRTLAVAFALAFPEAADAAPRTVSFAGISIVFDDKRWEPIPGADPDKRLTFVCIAPECHGTPYLWARAEPIGTARNPCFVSRGEWDNFAKHLDGFGPGGRDFGGLRLDGIATFDGCRRYVPKESLACGAAGGWAYTFGSGSHAGTCGPGIEGVPDEMFLELLSGIRIVPRSE